MKTKQSRPSFLSEAKGLLMLVKEVMEAVLNTPTPVLRCVATRVISPPTLSDAYRTPRVPPTRLLAKEKAKARKRSACSNNPRPPIPPRALQPYRRTELETEDSHLLSCPLDEQRN